MSRPAPIRPGPGRGHPAAPAPPPGRGAAPTMRTRTTTLLTLAALLPHVLPACEPAGGAAQTAALEASAAARPQYVDSARTIEEELRRFRATLTEEPTALEHGERSRDALIRRFVRALETSDTAALLALHLTRAEFAYLYYPFTQYTRPPYELSPALLWFLIEQNSEKGLVRLLRRYGGRPLGYVGYLCEQAPQLEGANHLWHECRIRRKVASGELIEERLFGSIMERDGRYKFVSYANDL